jgi:hypothetical protein
MPRYPATKVPPSCENISIELAQQVLAESWGNVARAAGALGVPSRDFRFLVRTTPALTAVAEEASELFCDKAEGILRDALESENEMRRDVASRFVLSGKAAMRGWARPSSPAVAIEQPPSHQIVIKWLGEDKDESAPREVSEGSRALIDARPVEGDERSSEQTLQRSPTPEDVGYPGRRPFAAASGLDAARVQEVSNLAQALSPGAERLNQRHDTGGEPVGGTLHACGVPAASTPVLIEHQDAIVPKPVASTPTLPVWPGPHPPPPLVAHLYAPYAPAPRVALARPQDHCRRETHRARG